MEKHPRRVCPLLPPPLPSMSYRDLRRAEAQGVAFLFETALRYTAFLLQGKQPARAILALCRAIYLDPSGLESGTRQPYAAYVWILRNASGEGFLGNPWVSFHHQASRMHSDLKLKRNRAWALWHLTRRTLPDLPPDPRSRESPPDPAAIGQYLDQHGLCGEGRLFREILLS